MEYMDQKRDFDLFVISGWLIVETSSSNFGTVIYIYAQCRHETKQTSLTISDLGSGQLCALQTATNTSTISTCTQRKTIISVTVYMMMVYVFRIVIRNNISARQASTVSITRKLSSTVLLGESREHTERTPDNSTLPRYTIIICVAGLLWSCFCL